MLFSTAHNVQADQFLAFCTSVFSLFWASPASTCVTCVTCTTQPIWNVMSPACSDLSLSMLGEGVGGLFSNQRHLTILTGELLRHTHACENLLLHLLCSALTSAGCFADSGASVRWDHCVTCRYSQERQNLTPQGGCVCSITVSRGYNPLAGCDRLWMVCQEVANNSNLWRTFERAHM